MRKMFLSIILFGGLFFTGCNSDVINDGENVLPLVEELGSAVDLPNGLRVEWQGDKYMTTDGMAFTNRQVQELLEESSLRAIGLIDSKYRWSDRTVPYKFADGLSDEFKTKVLKAWENFHYSTCIVIREATNADKDFVLVTSESSGHWSYVGRLGGVQQLNLQDNSYYTFTTGKALRVMMNTLGFYSNGEIHRSDRSEYVTILWDNIAAGAEYNFEIYDSSIVTDFGVGFDYSSVLSDGPVYYSKNGQPTIVSRDPGNPYVTNEVGFSDKDILSINRMYGCQ